MKEHEPLLPVTDFALAAMMRATRTYQDSVWLAEDWLAARGLNAEAVSSFRLGVVGDPAPGHERMLGWLSIPYLGADRGGGETVLSIRFRCVQDHDHKVHGGKYMTLPGDQSRLFNVKVLSRTSSPVLHIAEGELDAIVLNQCGFPAVGVPGANNWKAHYARLLSGFETVYLWGDPDDAGKRLNSDLRKALGRSARVVHLVDGDVNDVFLQGGKAALAKALEGAV